jgi:hypothetical protein
MNETKLVIAFFVSFDSHTSLSISQSVPADMSDAKMVSFMCKIANLPSTALQSLVVVQNYEVVSHIVDGVDEIEA